MDPLAIAVAVAAVSIGAFVRGYSGFGSSLIWVSGMSIVFPPQQVVPAVYILELVASAGLLPGDPDTTLGDRNPHPIPVRVLDPS